jgi:hypothetical protein
LGAFRNPDLIRRGALLAHNLLATLLSAIALCAADPFVGTWKFNAAKSKSDVPMAKSATMTIKASDEGQSISRESVCCRWQASQDGGKIVFTARVTGPPDGRNLTIETKRTVADGKAGGSVSVWERQ